MREDDERGAGKERAGELQRETRCEETAEATPVLASREAEAVLDERFFDGEVEESLQEARGDDHRRVVAEVMNRVELAGGDDRRQETEHDGRVDADGRQRTADEKSAHQARV